MISLLLSILSSTVILILFKVIEKQKLDIFPPIVVNYIAATTFGFSINNTTTEFSLAIIQPWIIFTLIIGVMLIGNFYLIGNSTQKAGIGITTVSAKMSFVLPVLYSLLFDINDEINIKKSILILLALTSVVFVIFPNKYESKRSGSIFYPIIIFFGLGILDALVKYCQHHFINTPESSALFSALNFGVAAIIGVAILFISKNHIKSIFNIKVWLVGTVLGIANFGSMYFLINALNALKFNNSLVFGINNIGVVLASVVIAILIFKERFSKINWIGLILSLIVLIGMIKVFL